ncbi:DNA cytosine methyltransferase [Aureimonas glaciei]|uniref:Cytosine-specific methyltransferase n=1 Tax=Aureimonas glaciei TaxID=1776957 RepID=A0A916XUY0_9HYPH|nr:DNA cytosine methyltransferase [Aureimonas glaciei]GGD11955.1 cytosine-specific methyltransferase [Aureimonas glaciei]
MPKPTAVDLFCGAGGLSVGLADAGFETVFASDIDVASGMTYRRNHPEAEFHVGDVHQLSGDAIMKATGLVRGELDLLAGGPPCQGFSIIGARSLDDPRNDLFRQFIRIASELRPRSILIENVPGLMTFKNGDAMRQISEAFAEAGYSCSFAELLAAQYGAPQMRWRMVFVGFRNDLGIPRDHGIPEPTHGRRGIGELIANCKISEEDQTGFLRAIDAIGDLPPVASGEENPIYVGKPKRPYQVWARAGAPAKLSNHYAPRLSPQNLKRIGSLKAGQDWRDLPFDLLPAGMQQAKRKDHTRRYSRMTWDGVPRAIITRFRDPKSGEYSHPEQTRTISIREAARIQSFRDSFVFEGSLSEQYDQVGNAVPPLLGKAIGLEIAACLSGTATFRLKDPFSRRKGLRQIQLPFEML